MQLQATRKTNERRDKLLRRMLAIVSNGADATEQEAATHAYARRGAARRNPR